VVDLDLGEGEASAAPVREEAMTHMTEHAPVTIIGRFDPGDAIHAALREAVVHAAPHFGVVLNTRWVTPSDLGNLDDALSGTAAAVIAPSRTRETLELEPEIIAAIRWLRMHHLPTLAIEGGYHHLVIEWARNVLGRSDANATLFDDGTPMPVIDRLVAEPHPTMATARILPVEIHPTPGSLVGALYGDGPAREHFRSEDAFNPDYLPEFAASGMRAAATLELGDRSVIAGIESKSLPFYVGVGFLPQLGSQPARPHPLFRGLLNAALRG
jgi:CTP synthase